MSARLMSGGIPRFRMVVRTMVTRELIGMYEWERSAETGRLIPSAAPFVHWPELESVAA